MDSNKKSVIAKHSLDPGKKFAYKEPEEAFPYKAPTDEVKEKYKELFEFNRPLQPRLIKNISDKVISFLILLFFSPLVLLLLFLNLVEGIIIRENRGPLFFYYNAVSAGKIFKKYKIRLIKQKYIDKELQVKGDWHAFQNEWDPKSRTFLGQFVKKFYLDEIPQFYCILNGNMSMVGPRPIAVHHYERDLKQGNVTRYLLRAGLLGLGHINKGTPEMGNPVYEFEYAHQYIHSSCFSLFKLDLKIICKGIKLMIDGKGL